MFAVYADSFSPQDPLSGLVVGERPDPVAPDGWATITVQAASLNHHDLWSLRGVGLKDESLPMILGCDASGYDEDGNELPVGESGRIFVGNEMKFEGYTGGGGKDEIDGLLY